MLRFFDAIGIGGKYRYPALAAAGLLGIGAFILTHPSPNAEASNETALSCSSGEVAKVVRDIVHKHVFSRQGASMFDEAQFGGQLSNIVTESEKPLTCSADFRPKVVISKAFIAATGNQASFDARSTEKEVGDKFTARLSYDVKRTDVGRIYVQVTDGMDTFD